MKKKRVALLGATGSIGKSSLDVISKHKDIFDIVLLSAHSRECELEKLKSNWSSAICVLSGEEGGREKLIKAIGSAEPQITINGISGSAGLEPSIAAIKSGSNLALANKETVVMAGKLVLDLAKEKNVKIIPVDSEHSAIFHLIEGYEKTKVINEIILTASGGPFRDYSLREMEKASVEDALCHPTWNMGPKITVDSASMANKGLEIIEACALFNMPEEKIKVVIHPQSIVHSMIRLRNGVIYAQLSKPDMRHPIQDALFWPDTPPLKLDPLYFDSLTLDFKKCDNEKFPMIKYAREAARLKDLYPCAYNAANEIAAAAFLDKKIGFTDIPKLTENVLQKDWTCGSLCLEAVLQADTDAKKYAKSLI